MKALICPLNWGLGHASRCIPIIKELEKEGYEVFIMADGHPLRLLQREFPGIATIDYPSYAINYSASGTQTGAMLCQSPKIIKHIIREHRYLKKLQKKEKFDLILSDNRFGLWNKSTKSVYITHQLMIKMPRKLHFFEPLIWRVHRFFINRYDECWIPDVAGGDNLSGDLSHQYPLPKHAKFIGVLSRFEAPENKKTRSEYKIVILISGPEPQRSIFEREMIEKYKDNPQKTILLQGLPQKETRKSVIGNISVYSHLETNEISSILTGAEKIICRSGYSSVMDLAKLNCLRKAEFHPTPGQTEQEYLAAYHKKKTASFSEE
jgi:UDP:flavonoid glycosyltransferase YjiC (YdhE family)